MAEPYLAEIRMFAGNFAPQGWAFCNGQLLPISQHTAVFALIGTFYGGDGVTTFALPDLRSRVPIHQGTGAGLSGHAIGQSGGTETVTLNTNQMAQHNHMLMATANVGNASNPSGRLLAQLPPATLELYEEETTNVSLANTSLGDTGSSQPHENRQPFLCLNFIFALEGIFPSRN